MPNRIFTIAFTFLFALALFAQEEAPQENATEEQQPQTDLWRPDIMQDGRRIQIGDYAIENPYKQRNSKLLQGDNRNQLWRYFMHGVTDLRGYPVPWQALDTTPSSLLLDEGAVIDIPYKKSNLPAVSLVGEKSLRFPKPLLTGEQLAASRGEYIRVFIWIKGEDTGRKADLHTGSPTVKLTLVDGSGSEVATTAPLFKTRGTFPWFCYHIDVKVPFNFTIAQENAADASTEAPADAENADAENADEAPAAENSEEEAIRALAQQFIGIQGDAEQATVEAIAPGLYVTLVNPTFGVAWFSTLSWQKIKPEEALASPAAKRKALDPVTGSYAPNPDHDELPMHFLFGLSSDAKWNFLKGTQTLKPLVEIENLTECLQEGRNDWLFMYHALPYLYSLYNNGMLLKTMTEFEKGWDTALLEYIQSAQNPSTGLWEVNGVPNIFVTEAILKNTFSAQPPPYKDWTPPATPWKGNPQFKLAYADAIIESILSVQTKRNRRPAAWNNCAFSADLKDAPASSTLCDLPATAAAANILRYAIANGASEESAARANLAISQAWNFVMSILIMRNGLWKTSTGDSFSASQTALFDFLDATPWLTFRTSASVPAPQAQLALDEKLTLTASWKPEAPAVALRIFVAGNDVPPEALNETHLVAIIQPPAKSYTAKDPLILLQELAATGLQRWNFSPAANGNDYIAHKLASIPKDLKVFTKTTPQKLKLKQTDRKQLIYYAAVNAYGEMSEPITIPESVPQLESSEESEN